MAVPPNSELKSSDIQLAPLAVEVVAEPATARDAGVNELVQLQAPSVQRGANVKLREVGVTDPRTGKEPGRDMARHLLHREMAMRAHDATALAIKGNFAILNFPELGPFLPRAASSSRDDVKATSMTSFSASADTATLSPLDTLSPPISAPRTLSSCSSSLSSSSCTNNVSTLEELGEILGNIVELPQRGAICECESMVSDVMNNLVYSDLDMWADPSHDQMNSMESGIGSSF